MRELTIAEVETVSGAEPQPLTDLSDPNDPFYDQPGSFEFTMRDCALVSSGLSGGFCANAIQRGIAAENAANAENERQSDSHPCGYLSDAAAAAQAYEDATRTATTVDRAAYMASEAADAALRECVSR